MFFIVVSSFFSLYARKYEREEVGVREKERERERERENFDDESKQ